MSRYCAINEVHDCGSVIDDQYNSCLFLAGFSAKLSRDELRTWVIMARPDGAAQEMIYADNDVAMTSHGIPVMTMNPVFELLCVETNTFVNVYRPTPVPGVVHKWFSGPMNHDWGRHAPDVVNLLLDNFHYTRIDRMAPISDAEYNARVAGTSDDEEIAALLHVEELKAAEQIRKDFEFAQRLALQG